MGATRRCSCALTLGVLLGVPLAGCGGEACVSADRSDAEAGERLWEEAFAAEENDYGVGVAVDRCAGRLVVGATLSPSGIASVDAWFGGLSSDGEPRWDLRVEGGVDERVRAVVADGEGGWIVAGETEVSSDVGADIRGGWLLRLDADGSEVWRRSLGDEEEGRGRPVTFENVAIAGDGALVVAGFTIRGYERLPLAAAYTSTGELLWSHVRDRDMGVGTLRAALPLPDSEDTLFVGSLVTEGGRGLYVLRLSEAGEPVSELHRPEVSIGDAPAVLLPEGRSMLVSTGSALVELDLGGDVLRELALAEEELPTSFAVDEDGGIYAAGAWRVGAWDSQPWVLRMTRDFAREWGVIEERAGILRDVAVGPMGDAFVVGVVEAPPIEGRLEDENTDVWIARYAR